MPIGIIANVVCVFLGGLAGSAVGGRLTEEFKEKLTMIFGSCALAMGITSIVLVENMPAVVLAVITGTCLGILIKLGGRIRIAAVLMEKAASRILPQPAPDASEEEKAARTAELITVIILFCASGTGIYGSMISGMNGDHSILLAKSILDLFTALIFACTLGASVALVALPQAVIFLSLFYLASVIYPLTTPSMINDFKACGGFILLASGFRILKLKPFPTADMIPAMILVMPLSHLWSTFIVPML